MPPADAAAVLKRELRARVRAALRALPAADLQVQSASLVARLVASPHYAAARSVALYASMPGELDTAALLVRALRDRKRVFLPRVTSKPGRAMVMLEVRSVAEVGGWERSGWGIAEPPLERGRADAPADAALDLIVVPGVAFDASGARCGQGMGFYDTYFARYGRARSPMPRLVALALKPQLVDEVPMTERDWRVDDLLVAMDERGGDTDEPDSHS